MRLKYEEMLSGDAIPIRGVGHIRSPYLKELKPTSGIGIQQYNLYIAALSWDKDDLIDFLKATNGVTQKGVELLYNDKLQAYDVIVLRDTLRILLLKAMGFFLIEKIKWDEATKSFVTYNDSEEVGRINRDNFDDIRNAMLQLNYIGVGDDAKPTSFESEKARILWERAQRYKKELAKKHKPEEKYSLGNIISKLCSVGVGYTLLNIYDLTVFQLYDQFFQYGYLRAMGLNERIFSNHGGKKFKMEDWLKPILR